jgi:DNA-cytosine methyltransferase
MAVNLTRSSMRRRNPIWLLDDDLDTSRRQLSLTKTGRVAPVTIRLHKLVDSTAILARTWRYKPGRLTTSRAEIAEELLVLARAKRGTVVASQRFASREFAEYLRRRGLDFIFEVRASSARSGSTQGSLNNGHGAKWISLDLPVPIGDAHRDRLAFARIGQVKVWEQELELVAMAPGGLTDSSLVRYALSSRRQLAAGKLTVCLSWLRWLKLIDRRASAEESSTEPVSKTAPPPIGQALRPNIHRSAALDVELLHSLSQLEIPYRNGHSHSEPKPRTRAVVELFSGAGLLGLGFLAARSASYELIFSGEVDPVYVETVATTHRYLSTLSGRRESAPPSVEPIDLRKASSFDRVRSLGRVDIVIGGPPCQGFSSANRNSWNPNNPNNLLVDTFLRYVRELQPSAVVLENVQGILWTPKAGVTAGTSTAHHIMVSLKRAGFDVYARLLDAVWYGVPQRRTRFFLIGLRKGLSAEPGDLGDWGPFPRPTHGPSLKPYVTVREAIADLPRIGNGQLLAEMPYMQPEAHPLKTNVYLRLMRADAPQGLITDHITSRQADYVIERYERIPPGGNWEDIASLLTNYRDVHRTHSNIYRRLRWDEPAITIGHYRKAMIIHPDQNRGLSLREASRLQSIPDWFRFSGSPYGRRGGLMHKQQQLANAVSPLVAKAIAERLADLL